MEDTSKKFDSTDTQHGETWSGSIDELLDYLAQEQAAEEFNK